MKTNKNYPKDRDFLGLVQGCCNNPYWDVFFWATKEDGINGKSCFVSRDLEDMPELIRWVDLPDVDG